MGNLVASRSESNPSFSNSTTMSPPTESSQTQQSKSENEETHQPETINPTKENSIENQEKDPISEENNTEIQEKEGEEEEEEEGECGFCLFMKAGGCKDAFVDWEKCIEEGEKNGEDIVEKCFEVTSALKKCMDAHSDYYAPILQAEKAAEAEAVKEFEKEKEKELNVTKFEGSSSDS